MKHAVIVAIVAATVIVVLAIGLGVGLSRKGGDSSSYVTQLPASSSNQFLVAEVTTSDGQVVIARSYDGSPWEALQVQGQTIDVKCDQNKVCHASTKSPVQTRELSIPPQLINPSDNYLAARLLQQATFGPSKADIKFVTRVYENDFGQWIKDQMLLAPTSTRAYYRSRVNPRRLVTQNVTREIGAETQLCDMDTRWHQYVFELRDKNKLLTVRTDEVPNRFTLRIDGYLRGEVDSFLGKPWPGTNITAVTFPATMRICNIDERLGGTVVLSRNTSTVCDLSLTNPYINITLAGSPLQVVSANEALFVPVVGNRGGAFILKSRSVPCSNVSDVGGNSFIRQGNFTYRYDKRMRFISNTIDSPAIVGSSGNSQCPIITKSYLNRDSCVRRASCGSVVSFKSAPVTLNDTIIRAWYTDNQRYVYYIKGLRLESPFDISPCSSGSSRWMKMGTGACANPTNMDDTTRNTIANALSSSTDTNPYVRDISLSGASCTASASTIGAQISAGGNCWQHVHPDLYSVRDATRWTQIHDGNRQAMADGNPNPIMKWAQNRLAFISFPGSHPMQRWYDRRQNLPVIGRYGDVVDFQTLSTELQTEEIAVRVGALRNLPVGAEAPESCGSPNEEENQPDLGNHYIAYTQNTDITESIQQLEYQLPGQEDFTFVIQNVALFSDDQLRQRVAWTLSTIVVAAPNDIEFRDFPEAWLSYYDVFVRHATGNYFNILRDISYLPLMGTYLTYIRSRSFASGRAFPDENYAREIMQLFSVGLWKLNDDGTQKLNDQGQPMATYTNDDILDYARIWTGFDLAASRPNLGDSSSGATTSNMLDPMMIKPNLHDRFPKAKLDDGHIGDQYPLCDEMPPQSFLREGARFEFTGDLSVEGDLLDQEAPGLVGRRGRFAPVPGQSALYDALCAPRSSDKKCTFPVAVTLTSNLPCEGPQECEAGRVRVVKIRDTVANLTKYYTYVPPPCVRLTLFDTGRLLRRNPSRAQCADPSTMVGSPVCCNASDTTRSLNRFGSECLFAAETTDYTTAQMRCNKLGLVLCSSALRDRSVVNNTCAEDMYMWTSTPCTVQIQVYPTGQIGIIDANATQFFTVTKSSLGNVFRARWNNNRYPVSAGGKCPSPCTSEPTSTGATCICNITTNTTSIFSKISDLSAIAGSAAINAISSRAFIGAAKPSTFDSGTYSRCSSVECSNLNGVTVWLHSSDTNGALSEKTIFQLPPYRTGRRVRYLLNRLSTVQVGNSFSFRNPPRFDPLLGEQQDANRDYLSDNLWVRQAENEVDALLEHLFEHNNTAPFICYRLIQSMVTSNPSPRYVRSVVEAFRTGAYGDIQVTGEYGDLAAAVYAILMDREARSPLLEADPTFGMLRDPLMKLYQVMRSLEYQSPLNREVALWNLLGRFGVQPIRSPTVFSFYLPEYQPPGVVSSAGLVSPQAQITTSPNLIGFLNGITSLIDNGLTSCTDGFGIGQSRSGCNPDGTLQYAPPVNSTTAQIVDELDLLLTSKRLNSTTRAFFMQQYDMTLNTTKSNTTALKTLLKLFMTSLEFHSTNLNILSQSKRQPPAAVTSKGRRFKAIVVIFESGGCDSWNKVVPHSSCPAKDLYAEYQSVRQGAAINKTILFPVSVPSGSQPCNTYGVHPAMPKHRDLYNQKELSFLTNIGALVEPTTKAAMDARTVRLPPSLFAHNIMQRSIQNLYAQNGNSQGVLGRIVESLTEGSNPYKSSLFSFSGPVKMVQGKVTPDMLSSGGGVTRFRLYNNMSNAINNLTQFTSTSLFAETYADVLTNSLRNTEYLGGLIQNTTLSTNFTKSGFNQEMQMTAKLIKALSTKTDVERATFFLDRGGYDTHSTFDLSPMFSDIDSGLGSFAAEMKAQGMWDDVVVVSISDFARTLYANGDGTDHAWGGQHIVAGGKVAGGQIFGSYPTNLTDDSTLSLGRGRFIPTLPFESVWYGIAQWFGVPSAKMPYVLPNAANFNDAFLLSQDELFKR